MSKIIVTNEQVTHPQIYKEFVQQALTNDSRILIIDLVHPMHSIVNQVIENMVLHGVKKDTIQVLNKEHIHALKEDSMEAFMDVMGVWFMHGDFLDYKECFKDGEKHALITFCSQLVARGGCVLGSGTGAKMMSPYTIVDGTTYGALTQAVCMDPYKYQIDKKLQEDGVLLLVEGFSLFPFGAIDLDVVEYGRFGRLLEAMLNQRMRNGFGIDADTALIADLENLTLRVIGSNGVVLLDKKHATRNKIGNYSKYKKVDVSYLNGEDVYHIMLNGIISTNKPKVKVVNKDKTNPFQSGLFQGNMSFPQFIGKVLLSTPEDELIYDQKRDAYYVQTIMINEQNVSFEIRFYKTLNSVGFYKQKYSFEHIHMDILPIHIRMNYLR